MSSRLRNVFAVLMLCGLAWPAAASDLDRLSVFVALDSWSFLGADYRSRHHYDRYWHHHRHYGRPYFWSRYAHPHRYWVPRYYGHHRYYRHPPRFRWDDHRGRDRGWRDDDRRWRGHDRHWRDDDRRWRDRDHRRRDDHRGDARRDRHGD